MKDMENEGEANVSKKRDVFLPASIIIAGVLVAGSVIWSVGKRAEGPATPPPVPPVAGANIAAMRAVDASDHVRGDRGAKVMVVEYSDFECPYCKRFHDTMNATRAAYPGASWVYRHYPIATLHTKAAREAEAAECAAELGGADAFWKFADRIFEVTPSNDGLDPAELPAIAAYAGVDERLFASCLASGKYADAVAASVREAEALGVRGTPYAIFISENGVDENDFEFLTEINQQFAAQYPGEPVPFTFDEENGRIGMSGAFPVDLVKRIAGVLVNNH